MVNANYVLNLLYRVAQWNFRTRRKQIGTHTGLLAYSRLSGVPAAKYIHRQQLRFLHVRTSTYALAPVRQVGGHARVSARRRHRAQSGRNDLMRSSRCAAEYPEPEVRRHEAARKV